MNSKRVPDKYSFIIIARDEILWFTLCGVIAILKRYGNVFEPVVQKSTAIRPFKVTIFKRTLKVIENTITNFKCFLGTLDLDLPIVNIIECIFTKYKCKIKLINRRGIAF